MEFMVPLTPREVDLISTKQLILFFDLHGP